jgi:O-antigen biosynthesis protein
MGVVRELLRPWYLKWFYFQVWPERRPHGFRDCWDFPEAQGTRADYVFLPMADWHGPLQRTQQLAMALARQGRSCLYVNPHLGREFGQPYVLNRAMAVATVAPRVTELHVHLPLEPVFHHRVLRASEEDRVARAIAPLMKTGAVVVSCFPLWNGVAERLRAECGAVIVYDCHDWLAGFGNVAEELLARERDAMRDADSVVFSSRVLAERWEHGHAVVIRNAGDPEHFRLIPWRGRRERPVIGYAGALNHWFDSDAVAQAAELRPGWEFLLMGPVDTADVSRLRMLANVRLTGAVPYAKLPERLAECDVVLIPFKPTPLIEAVNPVKLYEYLACGLPVVSAPLPEVLAFRDHLYTYASGEDMAGTIEAALRDESQARREARRARVLEETWDARARELEASLATIGRRQ